MDLIKEIAAITPFNLLPEAVIEEIVASGKLEHTRKESLIYHQNYTPMKGIDIILSGGFQTYFVGNDLQKEMVEPMGAGEVYGPVSILYNGGASIRTVLIYPDTRYFRLPRAAFMSLIKNYPDFNDYYIKQFGAKMQTADYSRMVSREESPLNASVYDHFFTKSLSSLEPRPLIYCYADQSIQEAAQIMSVHKQSCIFIKNREGQTDGYMTDLLMREKIISQGVDLSQPIGDFAERPIFFISQDALIYEALLLMFKHKIRYIVLTENGEHKGLMTRSKLLTDQSYSPFVFIQSIKMAASLLELKSRWDQTPELVYQLLSRGTKAENVNKVINAVADEIMHKIIGSVIEETGPPPCRFVYMVLGSEGRKEQTLKTDQDNAIIYEDRPKEERSSIRAYFLQFAERVSHDLNEVGFVFCEGDYMARNPQWNHSLSHWKENYSGWIKDILPENAANFATFFDSRRVYGDRALIDELKVHIKRQLENANALLYYHLAVNALKFEPPLTSFFKNIKTISKDNEDVFNIKHAMSPIVDILRVYALKHQILVTNTGERLEELYRRQLFSKEQYYELLQAYYYLMAMRLKQQAKTILRKQGPPTNFIQPKGLTNIERVTLREIFKVIQRFQTKMKLEFTGVLS